ncbi:MAG: hypothetical protein WBV94_19005 [Blastocatellia bacterium]
MKRLITAILIVGLSPALLSSVGGAELKQYPSKSYDKPLIGYIKDDEIIDMCGCSFEHKTSSRGYTFTSDVEGKTAWMNIDEKDVKLGLTQTGGSAVHRMGSRYIQRYQADEVKVLIVMVVNRICKPYSSECETTGYDVTITVDTGRRRQTVKAKGQCGCV